MTSDSDDVLLVRRANVAEPAGEGVDTYVVVEVSARVDEPPLARCCVVRVDAHHAEIRDLEVAPEHRGRGLARRLMCEVADVLRAAGLRRVTGVHDGTCWLDIEL